MRAFLPILLALVAAVALAAGAVLQWLGHERCVRRGLSGWKVVLEPLWWAGIATSCVGTLSHYGALWTGLVVLVLPVSGLHLVFAALAMARIRRSTLSGWQPAGIALVVLGVGLCLWGELDRVGTSDRFAPHWGAPVALVAAALVLLPMVRGRAQKFAIGSGLAFGISAASWKLLSVPGSPWPRPAVAAGFAASYAIAFLLVQAGFRRGGAATVNATSNGVATATGVVCASALFGEPLGPAAWTGLSLVAAGVILSGREAAARG